jgi:beta-phosphoglucomutase-like phosphatase (HAD superfamily)
MVSRDACIMAVNAAHWTSKAPHTESRPSALPSPGLENAVPDTAPVITLSPRDYDAILFDLDGVLTQTARVHAAAWKRLFDRFLEQQSVETGESFVPFDINDDYRRHVDGKPRQDGVVAFLQSRRIDLPLGAPDDGPNVRTVHGLGNLKDQYFLEELDQKGVERYEASIEVVRALRAEDVKTGVVSSSNNCAAVLAAAEIADLCARASRTFTWHRRLEPT